MEAKTFRICGRNHVAVKVASSNGAQYTNYARPAKKAQSTWKA